MTYPEQPPHHSHRSSGMSSSQGSTSESGDGAAPADRAPKAAPEVSRLRWGQWYTLKELEAATEMFADENVIGEGGYGIVYHGVLEDGTQVGVKNLLNNRYVYYRTSTTFLTIQKWNLVWKFYSNLTLSSRMESVVNVEISVIICELRWLWISWENPHRFEVEFVGVSN